VSTAEALACGFGGAIVGGMLVYGLARQSIVEARERMIDRLEHIKTELLAWSANATLFGNFPMAHRLADQAQLIADQIKKVRNL
jgi:hypothetical protein